MTVEEPKNIAEWLESQGNPKHSIAEGEDGTMVIVIDDDDSLGNGIIIYSFKEYDFGDRKSFWMSSGWGLRKEYLPALKKFLNDETENSSEPEYLEFEVWEWVAEEGEDEESESQISVIKAVSEYHASALLRDGIKYGKFPKGAWLEYELNGKTIELNSEGRIKK